MLFMKIPAYLIPIIGFIVFFVVTFYVFNFSFRSSFLIGVVGFFLVISIETACSGSC